jgi:hypothetical protein
MRKQKHNLAHYHNLSASARLVTEKGVESNYVLSVPPLTIDDPARAEQDGSLFRETALEPGLVCAGT